MSVHAKIYLAVEGWKYEGEYVLGAYNDRDLALEKLDGVGFGDFVEIQVFALNGERIVDDPEELYRER